MLWNILPIIIANIVMSFIAGWASYYYMSQFMPIFIQRKLYGYDQCKVKIIKIKFGNYFNLRLKK